MKYIFKTNATMKEYNNNKWWIDSGVVREISVEAGNVKEALEAAISDSSDDDFIFVGGSCFIVADLLVALKK